MLRGARRTRLFGYTARENPRRHPAARRLRPGAPPGRATGGRGRPSAPSKKEVEASSSTRSSATTQDPRARAAREGREDQSRLHRRGRRTSHWTGRSGFSTIASVTIRVLDPPSSVVIEPPLRQAEPPPRRRRRAIVGLLRCLLRQRIRNRGGGARRGNWTSSSVHDASPAASASLRGGRDREAPRLQRGSVLARASPHSLRIARPAFRAPLRPAPRIERARPAEPMRTSFLRARECARRRGGRASPEDKVELLLGRLQTVARPSLFFGAADTCARSRARPCMAARRSSTRRRAAGVAPSRPPAAR